MYVLVRAGLYPGLSVYCLLLTASPVLQSICFGVREILFCTSVLVEQCVCVHPLQECVCVLASVSVPVSVCLSLCSGGGISLDAFLQIFEVYVRVPIRCTFGIVPRAGALLYFGTEMETSKYVVGNPTLTLWVIPSQPRFQVQPTCPSDPLP